jgi:hypothetical protein
VFWSAVNSGDGCAMNITGTTSVTVTASRAPTEYPWTLSPTSRVIRPAERFEYLIVHLSGVLGWKFPGVTPVRAIPLFARRGRIAPLHRCALPSFHAKVLTLLKRPLGFRREGL